MEYYPFFRITHVTMVILSGSLFALRACWMLLGSARLQQKWVRVLPHIIDTLLLVSAICLLFILQYNPFTTGWLLAKIIALLGYIIAGSVALKRGSSMKVRSLFLVAALLLFSYIVAVAVTRSAVIGIF